MSRYLTEGDIKEQYVLFDPERFSPLGLIKLRFLDMVAVYEFPVETGLEDKYADFKKVRSHPLPGASHIPEPSPTLPRFSLPALLYQGQRIQVESESRR